MKLFSACANNSVGISNRTIIRNQRFSASSSHRDNKPFVGRLNGASAWKPIRKDYLEDYLQIDLGAVYFVCSVATQGNPNADEWTKNYKIRTSLDNDIWKMYREDNAVKVLVFCYFTKL